MVTYTTFLDKGRASKAAPVHAEIAFARCSASLASAELVSAGAVRAAARAVGSHGSDAGSPVDDNLGSC